jgi:tripartite-type tricarboxylate transporter receptor subunit TctC
MSMARWRIALAALVTLFAAYAIAAAQDYPTRPITLIVPFPPGGSTTIVARIVGEKMSETLGQQIVIDNRGGAGGTLGTRSAAKSPPDGYTILLSYTATVAIGPSLYPNVGYDPRKDFASIGLIGTAPSVLVVHPSVSARSVAELIKLIKETGGKFQYGSPGVGTVNHLAAELFAHTAGLQMTHIPYKGSGPALNDLLGGHILMMFVPIPAAHGNIAAGKLRALAVTSEKRSKLLPDVPTVAESGLPGFDVALRYGLVAPAGTPRTIIDRLNKDLRAALASEEVVRRLATDGAEPLSSTPEEYAADIDREETKWSKLVKSIGLRVTE